MDAVAPGGAISFDQFTKHTTEALKVKDISRECDECFKLFDRENNGQIQMSNLRSILRNVGEPKLSDKEVDEMLSETAEEVGGKVPMVIDRPGFDRMCTCPLRE